MQRVTWLIVITCVLASSAFAAPDQLAPMDAKQATIYQQQGHPLTGISQAAPGAVVTKFLREQGISITTANSLYVVSQYRSPVTGLTHVQMGQRVAGLRVEGAYVKAALTAHGELVHLIQNIATVNTATLAAARVNELQALRAALAGLYPTFRGDLGTGTRQDANSTVFKGGTFFYEPPRVERVALLMQSGALQPGFLVETWKNAGNLLHESIVSGGGQVLAVEQRTSTDAYNIFPKDPGATAQTVVTNPAGPESPAGWLGAGSQTSINIGGNNAHAYLDRDNNNAPDTGGDPVTNGEFLSVADLGSSPTIAVNQNVAIQNLFYLNNLTHDMLYRHGFVEGAGNFQDNNFGNGGRGNDSVNAEGQDGGGTDNANFATPRDGRHPRMQMYLWTGRGTNQVIVNATTYPAEGAEFGPDLSTTGLNNEMAVVNDGSGTTSDGCEAFSGFSGKVAVVDRGTCTFVTKARNAQNAGAVGLIVVNNVSTPPFSMGDDGTGADITIPPIMVSLSDGTTIKNSLPLVGTMRLTDPQPLQLDGDVDSDIVYHEYGHGLTWRMIGRMNGSLSGAIGEGMSDVLSILFNGNDVVGEYAFSYSGGIRTEPYANYSRTYGDVTGSEVHFDGEVYGAIGWRLRQNFLGAGVSVDQLLDYIVDGMNYTPAAPSFEDMRDGILQSVSNAGLGHECLVWDAFADYGVGVGAVGRTRGSTVVVTESFTLPGGCTAIP